MNLLMLYLQISGSATQFTFGNTTGSGSGSPPPHPARTPKAEVVERFSCADDAQLWIESHQYLRVKDDRT